MLRACPATIPKQSRATLGVHRECRMHIGRGLCSDQKIIAMPKCSATKTPASVRMPPNARWDVTRIDVMDASPLCSNNTHVLDHTEMVLHPKTRLQHPNNKRGACAQLAPAYACAKNCRIWKRSGKQYIVPNATRTQQSSRTLIKGCATPKLITHALSRNGRTQLPARMRKLRTT